MDDTPSNGAAAINGQGRPRRRRVVRIDPVWLAVLAENQVADVGWLRQADPCVERAADYLQYNDQPTYDDGLIWPSEVSQLKLADRQEFLAEVLRLDYLDVREPESDLPPCPDPPDMVAIPNELITGELLLSLQCRRFAMIAKALRRDTRRVRVDPDYLVYALGKSVWTIQRWVKEAHDAHLFRFTISQAGWWTLRLEDRLNYPYGDFTWVPKEVLMNRELSHQEAMILAYLEHRGARQDWAPVPQSAFCRAINLTPRSLRKLRKRPAGEDNLRPWITKLIDAGRIEVEDGRPHRYLIPKARRCR